MEDIDSICEFGVMGLPTFPPQRGRGPGCVIPILIVIAIGAAMFIAGFSCGARL